MNMKKNLTAVYLALVILLVYVAGIGMLFTGNGGKDVTSAYTVEEFKSINQHDNDDSETEADEFQLDQSVSADVY